MDKNRRLLLAVRALGLLSAAVLFVAKFPYVRLMEALTVHDTVYGDTYRDVKLAPFRIRLPDPVGPPLLQSVPGTTADYRLFITGDSYLPENRGHEPFVRRLSTALREPVFFASITPSDPACLFRGETPGARTGRGRVVVVERAERYVSRFAAMRPCEPTVAPPQGARLVAEKLFKQLFEQDTEERLRYFLLNSVLTAPLVEAWNTQLYLRFGILPDLSPVVSKDPPYLFARLETDPALATSFYAEHDDALISAIADGLERTAKTLRDDYGAELIFVPIPNKFTLYHGLARNDRYDDYLPRLYKELGRRGIRYVDLYRPFMASKESVYWPTDTHWNGHGAALALDAVVRAVQDARKR